MISTKHEARSSKQISNSNDKNPKHEFRSFEFSSFVLVSDFVFRASNLDSIWEYL